MELKDTQALENSSSTPLYLQLYGMLKSALDRGEIAPGDKLPTEEELSTTCHVSRVTVRKALALLEKEERIERKIGKGTYAAEKKLRRNLTGNGSSFTRMCNDMGTTASAKTIRISIEEPSESEAELLSVPEDTKLLLIERIRLSDDQPVMFERDFLPESFDFLFSEDLNHNSLYALIHEKKGILFCNAKKTIEIIFAQPREAKLLGVKNGYPLLRIVSISEDKSGQVKTLSEQLCIGDRFRLQV